MSHRQQNRLRPTSNLHQLRISRRFFNNMNPKPHLNRSNIPHNLNPHIKSFTVLCFRDFITINLFFSRTVNDFAGQPTAKNCRKSMGHPQTRKTIAVMCSLQRFHSAGKGVYNGQPYDTLRLHNMVCRILLCGVAIRVCQQHCGQWPMGKPRLSVGTLVPHLRRGRCFGHGVIQVAPYIGPEHSLVGHLSYLHVRQRDSGIRNIGTYGKSVPCSLVGLQQPSPEP